MSKTKKANVDQILSTRKDFSESGAILKAAKAPASWDKNARSARFCMSAQVRDRYNDLVITDGILTDEFERNPVGLLFHSSREWPVATWANLEKQSRGRPPRLEGDFVLLPVDAPAGLGEKISETEWMLANGGIRACSIGFIPNWDAAEMILDDDGNWDGGVKFGLSILVECSICAVPANPLSLVRDAGKMNLARELIEDILDNWAKTPEGLLIPRAEYEAAHKAATGERTTVVIKTPDDEEDIPADWETIHHLKRIFIACKISGADYKSMKDADARKIISDEVARRAADAAIKGDLLPDGTIAAKDMVVDPLVVLQSDIQPAKDEQAGTTKDLGASANTDELAATVAAEMAAIEERTKGFSESLVEKIQQFFRSNAPQERVEPAFEPPPPPSPEAIAAARMRSASVRERVTAKVA